MYAEKTLYRKIIYHLVIIGR